MKNRSIHHTRPSNLLRRRTLQFDVLEDRRLFAGLEGSLRVFVFEDPMSVRTPNEATQPAAERVVFVDLNRDGVFQSPEPWSLTDKQGFASFQGLSPGDYSIRVISHRSVVETTSNQPSEAGVWTSTLGVQKALDWESDTVGWFVADHSLQKWDVAGGKLLHEIDVRVPIASVEALNPTSWLLLTRNPTGPQLATVDRQSGDVRVIPFDVGKIHSFTVMGGNILVSASNEQGQGLYRIAKNGDSLPSLSSRIALQSFGGLSSEGTSVHAIGDQELVLVEKLAADTRVSSWQSRSGDWQLVAERMFKGEVRFASSLSSAKSFVVELSGGLAILNNVSGFPIHELIERASGPTVFDTSRSILFTHSKDKPGTISAWSATDWGHLYDIPVLTSAAAVRELPWVLSLGFLNDHLVSVVDGKIYRHELTAAEGVAVSISDSEIREVAIGLRTRGTNRAPKLNELPDFATDEDVPLTLPHDAIASKGSDEDGDSLVYFVRSAGSKGQMREVASDFAVFVPTFNANGTDSWSVQAYDGRAWSETQSFHIDIRPVNDLPSGIAGGNEYRVSELSPGASLGRLEVMDQDIDAAYQYAVSDERFMVANGLLKLVPGLELDYESTTRLVVTVSAIEVNHKDVISKQVTVQVEDRNDPPQGILFTGSGAIPEKVAPYVVGNVSVIDQDRFEVFNVSVSDPRFEVVGNTVRIKPGLGIVYQQPGWVELTFTAVSQNTGDTLSRTERFQVIKDKTPCHNDENPMDVDGDGVITPLDPLFVINYINNHGPGEVSSGEGESAGQIDVDGDGQVTPIDILIIINALNDRNSQSMGSPSSGKSSLPNAEGESVVPGKAKAALDSNALRDPREQPLTRPPGWSDDELLGRRQRRFAR